MADVWILWRFFISLSDKVFVTRGVSLESFGMMGIFVRSRCCLKLMFFRKLRLWWSVEALRLRERTIGQKGLVLWPP